MTSPRTPGPPTPAAAITCVEADCERPVVHSSDRCRIHLADLLRREGEDIPFRDPGIDSIWAVVIHVVRIALDGLPEEMLAADDDRGGIDVVAVIDGRIDRQLPHMVMDVLATYLSDMFGEMRLYPPKDHEGDTAIVCRVFVPARAVDTLAVRISDATASLMAEMFGAGLISYGAVPVEDSDGRAN